MNSISGPATSGSAPVSHLSRPAKFSVPPRLDDLLRRPRLLDFLHANVQRRLLLVSAAAGYGKSALLTDFAHDTDYAVAWFRLDEADRDLTVLIGNLALALRHAFPNFQSQVPAQAAEPAARPEDLANALNREIATGIDHYFILVLDDYHLVAESAPVARFTDALLAGLSEQAHLLIAGRTIPPLRLSLLTVRNQVAGLSEEHLRFTPDEVRELLQLRNRIALPEGEAEKLVTNTEGWITGILLTTHLMWQGMISSLMQAQRSGAAVYEYLAAEVLDQQPEPLRQFMLDAAVLPDMEPEVCDAVLGRTDSALLLRQAEDRHLFVNAVGDEQRAYQYHHLFRDFLTARLRAEDPERLRALQARAAEWYASNDMVEAAVTFYLLAGRFGRAAEIVEANARDMFAAGRHATLRRWAEQLTTTASEVPSLYLNLAKADIAVGDLDAAEVGLQLAAAGFGKHPNSVAALEVDVQRSLVLYRRGEFEAALALASAAVPRAQALQQVELAALALRYIGLCQFALGQLAAAEQSLHEVVRLQSDSQNRFNLAWAYNDLAWILRVRGQSAQAAKAQAQALKIWREQAAPSPLATALNNVGWDFHMLGQYDSALDTYREALGWAQKAGSDHLEAVILCAQADLFVDVGQLKVASDLYRQAMKRSERVDDWTVTASICRGMAQLDRRSGNHIAALEWLRRAVLAAGDGRGQAPLVNIDGLRGIILVEMGQVDEGRRVLDEVCASLKESGAAVDLAQSLLFRACAEFRQGEAQAARESLKQALSLTRTVGYDQILVSEALPARDVLAASSDDPEIGARVRGLLARAEAAPSLVTAGEPDETAQTASPPGPVERASLEVRALGQSRVFRNGEEIPRASWALQRSRELFLFLIDRAPIHRDKVVEAFWPEKTGASASNNLHQVLFRLRKALGDEVVIQEDQEFRLAPGVGIDYDVTRFESAARSALSRAPRDIRQLGALNTALQLFTGEYLADLPVGWAAERRRSLNDVYVSLLCRKADELIFLTRYAEARESLVRALVVEPLRDDIHERMLVCLAGLGRRHEVVDHYRRYRDQLRSELGLDPPPEMRELYAQLIT